MIGRRSMGFVRTKGSAPNAPSGLVISYSGIGELIFYSFTDNASDETSFRVEYSLNYDSFVFGETLSPNDTSDSLNITGYSDGITPLEFRIRAENAFGTSVWVLSNILNEF